MYINELILEPGVLKHRHLAAGHWPLRNAVWDHWHKVHATL